MTKTWKDGYLGGSESCIISGLTAICQGRSRLQQLYDWLVN